MTMLKSKTFHILLLIIVAAGVYASSLGGDFVYDDKAMIATYDLVKDTANIPKAFTSPTSIYGNTNYYRPLQTISYIIDYFLWGDFTPGYHAINILFHILAVVLVYVLILILFKNRILAVLTSLIFVVHPAHVSVVAYIAGRADAMLLVSLLGCLIFYIRANYARKQYTFNFVLSIIFYVVALLTKELALIIPFMLIVFDKYLRGYTAIECQRTPKNRTYIPYFLVSIAYILFRVNSMSFSVEGSIQPAPFLNRLITAPYVLFQYIRIFIFPNDLHMGRSVFVLNNLLDDRLFGALLVMGILGVAAYRIRRQNKSVWFGLVWFVLMILPSLNVFVPLFYTIAENWLYIPSVGLSLVCASFILWIYAYLKKQGYKKLSFLAVIVAGILIFSMGAATIRYNATWANEASLALNTLRFNPKEFKMYNNLGVTYLGRGELQKAEDAFKSCLKIKPDTGMAYFNLYRVYMAQGKKKDAVQCLRKAEQLDPRRILILKEKMGIRD